MALSTDVCVTANVAMCVCMSYVPAVDILFFIWCYICVRCYTLCSGTLMNLSIMINYCVCSGISSHLIHIATVLKVNNEFVNWCALN